MRERARREHPRQRHHPADAAPGHQLPQHHHGQRRRRCRFAGDLRRRLDRPLRARQRRRSRCHLHIDLVQIRLRGRQPLLGKDSLRADRLPRRQRADRHRCPHRLRRHRQGHLQGRSRDVPGHGRRTRRRHGRALLQRCRERHLQSVRLPARQPLVRLHGRRQRTDPDRHCRADAGEYPRLPLHQHRTGVHGRAGRRPLCLGGQVGQHLLLDQRRRAVMRRHVVRHRREQQPSSSLRPGSIPRSSIRRAISSPARR